MELPNEEKKEAQQQSNNPTKNSTSVPANNSSPQEKPQQLNKIDIIAKEIKEIFEEQTYIIQKNLFKKNDFFEIELIVLKEMIQGEKDITLLIIVPFTYPSSEPEIYCLTEFCTPHICDGRNLLNDIIRKPWQRKVHTVDFVVNKLPGFFLWFNEQRKIKKNLIVGKFVLNKLYMINRLKELPIYFHLITHKEKKSALSFTSVKTHKIITISEISFCMYELDNSHTGYCKLVFFADLKDLINTRVDNKNNYIEIKWKNPENEKKIIKIEIISPDVEVINKILFENKKEFFSLDNNNKELNDKKQNKENKESLDKNKENKKNKDNAKEKGENSNNEVNSEIKNEKPKENKEENIKKNPVPNINIMMIEKQIVYVEKSLNVGEKPNKEQLNYLMKLYQNSFAYYSIVNDDKQNIIKSKIDKLQQILNSVKAQNKQKNESIEEPEKIDKNEEIKIENKKEEKIDIIKEVKEVKVEKENESIKKEEKKVENKDGKNNNIQEIKKEENKNVEKKENNINLKNDKKEIKEEKKVETNLKNKGNENNLINFDYIEENNTNKNDNVFDFISFDNNVNQTKNEVNTNNNNVNLLDLGFDFTGSYSNAPPNKNENKKETPENKIDNNKNENNQMIMERL